MDEEFNRYRYFLKDSIRKTIDFSKTDQSKGVAPPPIEKPYSPDSKRLELITTDWDEIFDTTLTQAIKNRKTGEATSRFHSHYLNYHSFCGPLRGCVYILVVMPSAQFLLQDAAMHWKPIW